VEGPAFVEEGGITMLANRLARRIAGRRDRSAGPEPGHAAQLIDRIRESVIGDDVVLDGPFGPRRLVYADYTASGRALSFIEDHVRDRVLPLYANTHTEASATGLHTTALREDARGIIHEAVNGGPDDVVAFCGSGATGAIDKLVRVLDLQGAVVFVGPHEHHSNELPWRESGADVVAIGEDADGRVDLEHLEFELERHEHRRLKIGTFTAASNVTGIITDVDAVSIALHRRGALSFWDYASAGPYLPIDMNPAPGIPASRLAYKDAVFVAPHKFVGGPGTPGVLVAKRALFANPVPTVPSGGTILFVSPTRQSYHPEPAIREEGGTPAIVESIRAGLVFALKEAVGAQEIGRREGDFARRALRSFKRNPQIEILGNPDLGRLAIVSLGVRHGQGLLHSNFVVAVLSDLFGIQARSGCFCAGPYIHRMYPIDDEWSERMDAEVARGHMGAKLAFVRLSFNYFMSETVFEYILEAVHLVAEEGWKLLPLYSFDPESGLWRHAEARPRVPLALADVLTPTAAIATAPESVLPGYLERAREVIRAVEARPPSAPPVPALTPEFERIRWFPLPGEALATMHRRTVAPDAALALTS
jgi:selenocysteine lyase/cysteine desulfurase